MPIIRNDSIRHTSVQSKTNTKTDTRIENSHDDDRGITGFFKDGNQYKELHEDMVAYASINKKGEPRLQATPPFNDGVALSETHDTEHIRNYSIRHTSVQSKTNTKTDSSRIENSRDEIYINNFLCLYVPV